MRYLLLFLSLVSLPVGVWAQYSLSGSVRNEKGQTLTGATVYLHELRLGVVTDSQGKFVFTALKPGNYHLHLQHIGYTARTIDIQLRDQSLELPLVMKAATLELREVIIESDLLKLGEEEQSQSTEVVSSAQIRKFNGVTLMQSLERLPGINSINTGIGVSKPVIRGLSFNRVAVTDQGIKQEGQQWGLDHGLEIDQFAVGRVEIIKGPASLLYGSDAMGGVIQIKPAPFPMQGQMQADFTQLYRSVNHQFGSSLQLAGHQGDWVWRGRVTWQDYGDYFLPADSFTYNRFKLALPGRRLKNTGGEELHTSFTGGVQKRWGFSHLTFSRYHQRIGYFPGALGKPMAYQLADDTNRRDIDLPHQEINHYKVLSNSNVQLGAHWLEIDLGWQFNHRDERSYPHAHGRVTIDSSQTLAHGLRLSTLSGQTRLHYRIDSLNRLVAGVSVQQQQHRIAGYEFLVPEYLVQQGGVFVVWQGRRSESFHWNAGVRYDRARLQSVRYVELLSDGSARERAPLLDRRFQNFSASAGISWLPHPLWQLKFNAGRSFRIPTIPELTSNGVHHGSFRHEQGDPSLNPEQGYQFDLGVIYRSSTVELKFSPYLNYFSNYIYLRPTGLFSFLPDGGQLMRYEQGEVLHQGAELSAELHLVERLHLAMQTSYTRFTNLTTGVPLPWIPPLQGLAELEYTFREPVSWLSSPALGTDIQLMAAQNRTDRNEAPTPGYALLHLYASTRVVVGKQRPELRLQVNNVFDRPYFNHLSRYRLLNLPDPGRNIQLVVHWPLGL